MRRLLLTPLLLLSMPAWAQSNRFPPSDTVDTDIVLLGASGAYIPDYEGSRDMRWTGGPGGLAQHKGFSVTWRGNRAWADLIPDNKGKPGLDLSLGPLFNINFDRTATVSDPQVRALGKIPVAIEGGIQAGIGYQGVITSAYDRIAVSVGYVHDLGTVHKSYVFSPQIAYSTPLSHKTFVYLNLGADYAGSGYARRYFGITAQGAAASGLPQYTPGAGWKDWTATGVGVVSLTGDLTHGIQLLGAVAYSGLIGDVGASPVVRSRDQFIGALGLAYSF
jgi:outer membrane scaffolding protein for murein synthesis (MipA/OmpV family)